MKKLWRYLLAYFRLDLKVVCEVAKNHGPDFHDYPDAIEGQPMHFYFHNCKRCGKRFTI